MLPAVRVEEIGPGQQGIRVDFTPTPVVERFIHDARFITGLFGPLGTAKTTGGAHKAYNYAQAFPGSRIAVVRDTWPSLRDTTQQTFFDWFPPGLCGTYHKTEKRYVLRTRDPARPSEIWFRALDDEKDIKNVLSLELAAAWFDEPQGGPTLTGGTDPGIAVDLFRSVLGRVGRQRGYPLKMVWLTGNPPPPRHWIAEEFGYTGHGPAPAGDARHQLYLVDRFENLANLHPTYYQDLMALWGRSTPLARRFIFGEWVEFATAQPFHDAWILHWTEEADTELTLPPRENLVIEAAVDPAISKLDAADKSAIVVLGQAQRGLHRGRIYELFHEAGHWSAYETADRLIKAYRTYGVRTVRVEDVAYQRALAEVLEAQARAAGVNLHVSLVKPDADKLRRANAWSALVEQGRVLLAPGSIGLRRAMTGVPMDRTLWDLVDAMGMGVRGFSVLDAERERIPGTEPTTPAVATSYAPRRDRQGGRGKSLRVALGRRPPKGQQQGTRRAQGYAPRRDRTPAGTGAGPRP
jgi:phage terminase large subunit-like protein